MEKKQENQEEFIRGYPTVQEFSTDGFKRVVSAVKAFQALPQPGPLWDLQKSYPKFSKSMKNARAKMIPMMASLLKHVNISTADFRSRDRDEKFDFLVECNDDLLERIGSSLDEADGFKKRSEIVVVDKGAASTSMKPPGTWGKRKLESLLNDASAELEDGSSNSDATKNRPIKKAHYRQRVMEKPQLKFSKPIDNSTAPFVPKLKEKPYSVKPLSILPEYTSKNEEYYGHPYAVELNKWEPSDAMLKKVDPERPKELKDTPVVYISNQRDLNRLMQDLMSKKEIAIDLEHHSFRTYLGLTCLIQISTRDKDYVIDSLSLREELGVLNEVFANPKIVKVFHGATSDIDWLQKDFGLYVVNMFDTYIAAKILGLPQLSLQYLLGKYCEVSQNKSLQLADWRLRPLPNDMLEYARQDTHYLLYIYERLRNELIEAGNQHGNLILSAYDQSRLTCLKRYEKPVSNAQLALRKTRRSLNNRQLYAFTEIYKWRDETAREKDESLGYVLPNHMLLTISESLPKEMNGILACCDPVPPLIHTNLGKIHKIITTARELPLRQETTTKDKGEKKVKLKNWVVIVNSIHDVTYDEPETNGVGDEDDFPMKTVPTEPISEAWPQSWTDPGDWQQFLGNSSKPSLKFNRKLPFTKRTIQDLRVTSSDNIKTPYARYQVSQKILDMLKDPEKQKEIDLEDPLIKAVYEAVLIPDDPEANGDSGETDDARIPEPAKVLDDGEFIPFNPLGTSDSKRRKTKRPKQEPWDDVKPNVQNQNQNVFGNVKVEKVESDDDVIEVEASNSSTIMNSGKQKQKRKKGKLLNRIKNTFAKNRGGKYEVEAAQQSEDSNANNERWQGGIEEIDEPRVAPPKKIMKQGAHNEQQPRQNQNRSGNRRSPRKNFNERKNSTAGQDGSFQKGDKNKNKTAIFKAWKRDKSITFK